MASGGFTKKDGNRIEYKIDVINEEVRLNSFDSSMVASLVFFITFLSGIIASENFLKGLIKYPLLLIIFLYLIPTLLIGFLPATSNYFLSLFIKKDRFSSKLLAIQTLSFTGFLSVSMAVTFVILYILKVQTKFWILFPLILCLISSLLFSWLYTFPKTINHFKKEFPKLYENSPIKATKLGNMFISLSSKLKKKKK